MEGAFLDAEKVPYNLAFSVGDCICLVSRVQCKEWQVKVS